jgi:uncharacterized RDD family membrane protein YckC
VTGPTGHEDGIVTPEAVLLEFSEAGIGSRSLAFLIDLALRVAMLYGVFFTVGVGGVALDETVVVVVLIASTFAVLLVYPMAFETAWNGRTPGKRVLGLRVVTVEGAPVRVRHAAIRSALGIVDFLVGAGSIAILSALATRRSQRLGDLAAGTIVVRERQAAAFSQPVVFQVPPGWEPFAGGLDVSRLGDDAYVVVRSFLLRIRELTTPARAELAAELRDRVARALGADLPAGTDPEGFLVTVAAAYQARHAAPGAGGHRRPPRSADPEPYWRQEQPPPTWGTAPTSS